MLGYNIQTETKGESLKLSKEKGEDGQENHSLLRELNPNAMGLHQRTYDGRLAARFTSFLPTRKHCISESYNFHSLDGCESIFHRRSFHDFPAVSDLWRGLPSAHYGGTIKSLIK